MTGGMAASVSIVILNFTPFCGLQEKVHTMKKMGSMKAKPRRGFSAEFKAEAVRQVQTSGKQVTQLARELEVPRQLLHSWVRQADRRQGKPLSDVFPGHGKRTAEEAELDQLRREVAQLKEDNEILKKATAFFAKHHR
jgi:transposase